MPEWIGHVANGDMGSGNLGLAQIRATPAIRASAVLEVHAADVFVFPSLTDTFGLVLLEALACGVPVAAYPVAGPLDVIGDAPVGCLNADLGLAVERALKASPVACRLHAESYSWAASTQQFLSNIRPFPTETFFAENGFFGLDGGRVHFFRQGRMPAVDFEGKILLETVDSIALSPDGHGGSLRALERSGALDLMKREGVDTLSYFQVDNPLVRGVDPAFIGWHLLRGSEMSSKTVPKAYAEEKVGHFCTQDGRTVVVEYSDLPLALQRETEAGGRLRFLAGSIAIHLLDREFVRRMAGGASALPFHRADKKIVTVDAMGQAVKPVKPNGVKFEMFVFDALPFARNPVIIETLRADDFSPVKNAEGVDSPQSCRDDQLRQFARWLKGNGAAIETDASGLPRLAIEVSPRFGYDEDSFADAWKKLSPRPEIRDGLYLETP